MEEWTDENDEANRHFLQFCERTYKIKENGNNIQYKMSVLSILSIQQDLCLLVQAQPDPSDSALTYCCCTFRVYCAEILPSSPSQDLRERVL